MRLPFTADQFLDIFAAYNVALWPFEGMLWIATAWVTFTLVSGRARSSVVVALAAAHWGWSGLVYHAFYFSRINPAAWIFAALFVIQAIAFVWAGARKVRLTFEHGRTFRRALGDTFLVLSAVYPILVWLSNHTYPRAPAYGVPCPTTLFTTGVLLTAVAPPRTLFAIPILWSLIGGSAALILDMPPDVTLLAAAVCLTCSCATPRVNISTGEG